MTRLVWGEVGERRYEAGVDRGVLYVDDNGVSWNGLVSISESLSGEEPQSYYIDGLKYANFVTGEEFEADIEAYTYPDEFSPCIGLSLVKNGLFAAQQAKKPFGLSYRTKIGNDVDGVDHAYKIHLVYNAIASSTEHDNNTINESVNADNFSWHLTTKPPSILMAQTGYKPTSHFFIDTRGIDVELISQVEDILYGTELELPRLPPVTELISMFYTYGLPILDPGPPPEDYILTLDGGTP